MSEDKAGGYISKLTFNDGSVVDINEDDIVLLVGPNNVGKSQTLKDIYDLSEQKRETTVISKIEMEKSEVSIESLLKTLSEVEDNGNFKTYRLLNKQFSVSQNFEMRYHISREHENYRDLFVKNLDTSARLSICNPPGIINRNDAKTHPIHYAAFDSKYRIWLSNNFKRAFGVAITPNVQFGRTIPLCIGDPVVLNGDYADEQSRLEDYAKILANYKQVHLQGDGVKSFTGILLYLMLDFYRTFLIDEPEAFLHPPQAKIMGEIIGETLSDKQQAFISTHSENIIKGLLEVCPERVKIIRITRENDVNSISVLDNQSFSNIWNDPLLKYSNIMSSLFYKTVVLCESDSDCKIYSIIDDYIKQKSGKYSETLFIHCGGKHRMAKISTALMALDINVKLIPDMDVLNDKVVFKSITEAFGIDWEDIEKDYNKVVKNISNNVRLEKKKVEENIASILAEGKETYLTKKEIEEIQKEITLPSKWKEIKKAGKAGLPAGDATASYNDLDKKLQAKGIFIVPVGELECFIKSVGGHGPEWANKVLEQYPDLDNEVYSEVISFIASMNL